MRNIFCKYFWIDLRFNVWTRPLHKLRLMRGVDYINWDLCDSYTDIMFKMFELFWKDYGYRFHILYEPDPNAPDDVNHYWCGERMDIHKEIILIAEYILFLRPRNAKTFDKIQDEYADTILCRWNKLQDSNLRKLEIEYLPEYFEIEWDWIQDYLTVSKVPPTNDNKLSVHNLEDEIRQLDRQYLHDIIKYKDYLWD